jgi:hypothetical protein
MSFLLPTTIIVLFVLAAFVAPARGRAARMRKLIRRIEELCGGPRRPRGLRVRRLKAEPDGPAALDQ